jgi:acetylornithine deacetylase/succinyl-diaminopimelate desuccinylase-like protein
MPAYGIPCLGLGPGHEPQAHAADEYCPVEHLTLAAAFYAALIATLSDKSTTKSGKG